MKKIFSYVLTALMLFTAATTNVFASTQVNLTAGDIDFYNPNGTVSIKIPEQVTTGTTGKVTVSNFTNYTTSYYWVDMKDASVASTVTQIKEYQNIVKDYIAFAEKYNAMSQEERATAQTELTNKQTAMTNAATALVPSLNQDATIMDDTTWQTAANDEFTVPDSDNFSDEMLIWVKVADNTNTKYMFRLYSPEIESGNPSTGISSAYIYIVPAAIIIGSALIIKRKRYE